MIAFVEMCCLMMVEKEDWMRGFYTHFFGGMADMVLSPPPPFFLSLHVLPTAAWHPWNGRRCRNPRTEGFSQIMPSYQIQTFDHVLSLAQLADARKGGNGKRYVQ